MMTDLYNQWALIQEKTLAVQKAQLEAAGRAFQSGEHFAGALEAAQKIAKAQADAWEKWMTMWGVRK